MFHFRGNQVSLMVGFNGAHECRVVTFSATTGKNYLPRFSTNEGCNLRPSLFNLPVKLSAKGMHTGGISIELTEVRQHLFKDLGGHLRRCVIVKVDCLHHSSTVISSLTSSPNFSSMPFIVTPPMGHATHIALSPMITLLPSTSISSMSPPSDWRRGRISFSITSCISAIFCKLVSFFGR